MQSIAEAACKIIIRHWSPRGVDTDTKSDNTPVTIADREVSEVVSRLVATSSLPLTLVTEERGGVIPRRGWGLVVDELDGTKEFGGGGREVAFACALLHNEITVASLIALPLAEDGPTIFWAEDGGWHSNKPLPHRDNSVAQTISVAVATAGAENELYDAPALITSLNSQGLVVVDVKSISYTCVQGALGNVYAIFFPWETPHDILPGAFILQQCGWKVTDLEGESAITASGKQVPRGLFARLSSSLIETWVTSALTQNPQNKW